MLSIGADYGLMACPGCAPIACFVWSCAEAAQAFDMSGTRRAIALGACGLLLAGCSFTLGNLFSDFSGPSKTLQVQSAPPGAVATASVGPSCQTPCALDLPAWGDFTLTFTLDGFVPQIVPIKYQRPEALIDQTAGFIPNPVTVALEPLPSPPPEPPPPPPPKKKPKPATARVAPQPPPPASAFPPPPPPLLPQQR